MHNTPDSPPDTTEQQRRFECPRIPGRLTLSVGACATQHKAAQHRDWAQRLPHCVDCPMGAQHAGVEVAAPFQRSAVCLRCGDGSGRLVMQRFCVSCYNREREWRLGANAKGRPPRDFKPLGRFVFVCAASGRRYMVEAVCVTEARLAAQKLWGLVNLVLDRRLSVLACQVTIFEEGRTIRAKTPCSGAKTYRELVDGPNGATARGGGGGGSV